MAALPWRPAIVLLRVLVAVVGVYTNSSPPPSTAISRCYANGADSPTNTNPKVLAVGGRVGSHVDLIVFMRSDGSVVSYGQESESSSAVDLVVDPKLTFALRSDEFLVSVTGSSSGLYRGDTISFMTSLNRVHTLAGTLSNSFEQFRFDARPGRHIIGLTWRTGSASIGETPSVVAGIRTASRVGCSTIVERFLTGGVSGATVSLLRGGMFVRKAFAKGAAGRNDFQTELGALKKLEALKDPRFSLLVNYTSPRGDSADAVIIQRFMGGMARRTAAAKLAISRLATDLAAEHALFHNDIKWANCCERVDPASGATVYSMIDYQWLSHGRPEFPYGQGVQRLDLEVGTGLPPMQPAELAAVLERSTHSGPHGEGNSQHVYGIAKSGAVWRLTRTVATHDVVEAISRIDSGSILAADSLCVVSTTDSGNQYHGQRSVIGFRSVGGAVHATDGRGYWWSSRSMANLVKGRPVVADIGSLALLALPSGDVALYCLDAVARSLHEVVLRPIAINASGAIFDVSDKPLLENLSSIAEDRMQSTWRAAGGTTVCATVGWDGQRRIFYVTEAGVVTAKTRAKSGDWTGMNIGEMTTTAKALPQTLACVADPYKGYKASVFFVEAPIAPESCSYDMYREPCRGKLHELRLNNNGKWVTGADLTTLPLQRAGEQRSQREVGRLSPSLHQRLLVSRLQPTDWQLERHCGSSTTISTDGRRTGANVTSTLVSIVYLTRNSALHEVIIAANGFGGNDYRTALRREITAPHSHPELFTLDGSSGGIFSAARAQEGGPLFAARSSDGLLLSF